MIDRDGLIVKLAPAYLAALVETAPSKESVDKCLGRPSDEMNQLERNARVTGRVLRDFATYLIMEVKLADDEAARDSDPIRRRAKRIA